MPRIQPIDPAGAQGRAKVIFDDFMRERGNIPNMFKTLAHRPEILETTFANFRAVMSPGDVPAKIKELVALRVSFRNRCDYCLASHTKIARKLGASPELIDGIARGDFALLTAEERAAVTLADEMEKDGHGVTDATAGAVRGFFGDRGLLEIVMVAGLFHYFNRVNNALGIEVTR
ncbi:MAG: carboxymuconolactone decarboxylase family protein [Planctomycetes bacterium]|nr:carboxymuconolactone decarboxylase family protein [Planctomycetota bacterium]